MDAAAFRRHGHELVDWIAEYLEHSDRYPVLSRVQPGEIAAALPPCAPEDPESFDTIMSDFERILVPGLTHWNHPGFSPTSPSPQVLPACSPNFSPRRSISRRCCGARRRRPPSSQRS